jgi:xanthine/CO dehydrogenase XdhC/CoxF family maturation factor
MKELQDLVEGWRRLPAGSPLVLATVVATTGSTYRKPGAKMLLTPDSWIAGSVSGGCLEADLVQTAWSRTANGPSLVTFDASADQDILWGFGLGCNGTVQVLLERIDDEGGPLAYFADRLDKNLPGCVATILSPGPDFGRHLYGIESEMRAEVQGTEMDVYFDVLARPLQLVIFGAGHDAMPLAQMAKSMGWRVTVFDRREAFLTQERFPQADDLIVGNSDQVSERMTIVPGAAVVLMTHHYMQDRDILKFALGSSASYVGVLGPRKRTDRLLQDLQDEGFLPTEEQLQRLHAPVGLNLGAEGPQEIALAVVAEIQGFSRSRNTGSLKDSSAPLHGFSSASPYPGEVTPARCGISV